MMVRVDFWGLGFVRRERERERALLKRGLEVKR